MIRPSPLVRACTGAAAALVFAGCSSGKQAPQAEEVGQHESALVSALPTPTLVKDLLTTMPTSATSNPQNFYVLGNKVLFAAASAQYGQEMWVSDGTVAGTMLLADINPGAANSSPKAFLTINGKAIFTATDGAHGNEVWVTDGTPAGTQMLKDIFPGTGNTMPVGSFTGTDKLAGVILFLADDGVHGGELWKTDGTPAGTVMVKDAAAGATASKLTGTWGLLGTKVVFGLDDGVNGYEPWITDGTDAGTVMLDLRPGPLPSKPGAFAIWNGKAFFAATDLSDATATATELAVTDGTQAGTHYIEVNPTGYSGPNINTMTPAGDRVYFTAGVPDPVNGSPFTNDIELWRTDGTTAVRVKDINTTVVSGTITGNSSPGNFNLINGTLFFTASDGTVAPSHGTELWKTDGTDAGTVMVADINPGTGNSGATNFFVVNGKLLFTAADTAATPAHGTEWWVSDGTTAGTTLLLDINPGTGNSGVSVPYLMGTTLFFSAADTTAATNHGTELWKTDGTTAGTMLVADINPGTASSSPLNFAALNGKLYFSATSAANGKEVWVSDGTAAGTTLFADVNVGTGSSSPNLFNNLNGNLFFTADNGTGAEVVVMPGFIGTPNFIDINPILASAFASGAEQFTAFNSKLYFVYGGDSTVGAELFSTDGTAASTGIVADVNQGTGAGLSTSASYLTVFNGALFFNGAGKIGTTSYGNELWKTDGTAAGTVQVHEFQTGSNGGSPSNLIVAGNQLFMKANDGSSAPGHGNEMWVSDGTDAGTVLTKDINSSGATGSNPGTPLRLGNKVIFTASDGTTHGVEPWVSDGTAAGTQLLLDVVPTPNIGGSISATSAEMDGYLYLAINDFGDALSTYAAGGELWRTDGTTAGTTLVKDIRPGTNAAGAVNSSAPDLFVTLGHKVIFIATTDAEGTELWSTDGTAAGTTLLKDIIPGVGSSTPSELIEVYGAVYFAATDATGGRELWKTDGTTAGTVRVKDINPGVGSSNPVQLVRFGNLVLFGASDGNNGREMWQSDGTAAGTVMLGDLWPGNGSAEPGKAVQVDGRAYVLATTPTEGREIFSTALPVADTVAPYIVCPLDVAASTPVDAAGVATYPAARGYDDRNGAITITYSQDSGTSFPIGETVVTATATDGANNHATCTFKVTRTYVDMEPPTITCPQAKSVASHNVNGIAVDFAATAADNKTANPTITYDHAPNSTFATGTTSVIATAADAAGNTATCSFDVTVNFVDNTPPTVTCPSNVTSTTNLNTPISVIYGAPSATDDAPGEITIGYSDVSGALFPVGINTVKVTGTDTAGNEGFCTFTVTVLFVDITPPVISCPSTVKIDSPYAEGIAATWNDATAIDVDSGLAPTITYSLQPNSTFPIGDTTVTATATDIGGNTDTCGFHVIVTLKDTTNPEITCPSNTTATTEVREGTKVNYDPATATDNLAPPPTISYSKDSGTLFPLGDTTVTATATDGFANTATCDFKVSVMLIDTKKPVVTCPDDVTAVAHTNAGTEVSYSPATASDNLTASPTITYSKASGSLFPVGDTTVTATATDEFANVGTCSFKVSVDLVDVGSPKLTCPQDVSASATADDGALVTWPDATATDDIDTTVPVTYEPANGTKFPVGASTVKASAKDKAGNTAVCEFHVNVKGVSSGCGCNAVDPGTFFGFAGLIVLLRRKRR